MDDPEWAAVMTVGTASRWTHLEPLDWKVLRLVADQRREGAGTQGLATALGVSEEAVIEAARRLHAAGFITLEEQG